MDEACEWIMPTPDEMKARVREICAPSRAEGRDLNDSERIALLGCIGEDVTDHIRFRRQEDGQSITYLDGGNWGRFRKYDESEGAGFSSGRRPFCVLIARRAACEKNPQHDYRFIACLARLLQCLESG